jgi:hypothetical protein
MNTMNTMNTTNTNINTINTKNVSPNIKNFLNNKNIIMLWEVLLDELHINPNSSTVVQNIKTVFDGNISLFTTRANPNAGLMNLNKLFLNQVLIAVNQLFPNLKQEQQMKLINISEEIIGEPYKVEDIHNARQTDFEKQVADKRNEFESSINLKKPQPVDFSDKVEPEMKIMEMEALIAETMAKRKFDIEQIQGTNANANANTNANTNTNTNVLKKSVSFDDNVTLHVDDYESINLTETSNIAKETSNIFNKLKKTTQVQSITPLITNDDKLSELNNKIDILVQMMGQILSLLEKEGK